MVYLMQIYTNKSFLQGILAMKQSTVPQVYGELCTQFCKFSEVTATLLNVFNMPRFTIVRIIVHLLQCKEDKVLWKWWHTLSCLCKLQNNDFNLSTCNIHAILLRSPFTMYMHHKKLTSITGRRQIAISQGEINGQWPATLLKHIQVYGAGWDPPKGTEQTGQVVTGAFSITYQQSWVTGSYQVGHPSAQKG